MTVSLTKACPDSNEGAYIWIKNGIHESVAFSSSICYYFNYVVDTALYPALFVSYFVELNSELFGSDLAFWLIVLGMVLCVTSLNLAGVQIQGWLSSAMTAYVLSPIPILFIWGAAAGWMAPDLWVEPPPSLNGSWSTWHTLTPSGMSVVANELNAALNVVLWSNTGYDAVGSLLTQLRDPDTMLGRSMAGAVMLSTSSYLLSVIGVLGAPPRGVFSQWQQGYFAQLGFLLGGVGMRTYVISAALVGSFGTIQALMLPISQQLYELCSEDRLDIPLFRYLTPRGRVPWVAVIFNSCITVSLAKLGFELLVQVNNIFYAVNLLLICVSYVRICRSRPLLFRLAVALSPALICAWLAVSMFWLVSWIAGLVCLACYVCFGGVWWLCRVRRGYKKKKLKDSDSDSADSQPLVNMAE